MLQRLVRRYPRDRRQAVCASEAESVASLPPLQESRQFWFARVNDGIRALAVPDGDDFVWFWIGDHREYDRLIAKG
jgi:hypothetical protein